MGSVWSATHSVTRRSVALKFLGAHLQIRPDAHRRFMREARAAAAVEHPNVVGVHDVFDAEEGVPVMVMDLLEGETMGQFLAREGPLSVEETAALMLPVVSAVGTAHAHGVVHRDLKPDNVFLAKDKHGNRLVKVLDFGIAKLASEDDQGTLTGTGATIGTPCYMSPEQGFGEKDIDHRADVWAIGVMLYEALSGRRPVEGDSLGQVLKRLMNDAITPLEALDPGIPEAMAALTKSMLEREREDRPTDLREVKTALQAFTEVEAPDFDAPKAASFSSEDGERVVISSNDAGRHDAGPHDAGPHDETERQVTPSARRAPDTAGPHSVTIDTSGGRRRTYLTVGAIAVVIFAAIGWRTWFNDATTASAEAEKSSAPAAAVEPPPEVDTKSEPKPAAPSPAAAPAAAPAAEQTPDAGAPQKSPPAKAPAAVAKKPPRPAARPVAKPPEKKPDPKAPPAVTAPEKEPPPAPAPKKGGLVVNPPF